MELRVELSESRQAWRPGEELTGQASWFLDEPAESLAVRLFWFTRGKGNQDLEVVDELLFEGAEQAGSRAFRFTLPGEPYSFSGTLISLIWAVELVVEPEELAERVEFVLSPTGQELRLDHAGAG